MAKSFLTHINLNGNEIQNANLQQLASAPGTPSKGRIYYNTTDDIVYVYDGSSWLNLVTGGGGEANTGGNVGAGAGVFKDKTGVTINMRSLVSGNTSLLTVTQGTDTITFAVVINDAGSSVNDLLSANEIDSRIASAVTGLLDFKGGYNASTNTPDLDVSPSGVLKGDTYVVTAAGNFFTEAVEIGDTLIAEIDNPTVLGDWVTVNKNIPVIPNSSESAAGLIEIATQTEANTGTDNTRAITPLKAKTAVAAGTWGSMRRHQQTLTSGSATYTVTHNFNTLDVQVEVYDATNNETVIVDVDRTTVNAVEIRFSVATSNNFVAIVMG